MVIWLRRVNAQIGVEDGLIRRDDFARIVELDATLNQLEERRLAILGKATRDAQDIVTAAQAEASKLLDSAKRQFLDSARRGHSEGYRKGSQEVGLRLKETISSARGASKVWRDRIAALILGALQTLTESDGGAARLKKIRTTVTIALKNMPVHEVKVCSAELEAAKVIFGGADPAFANLGRCEVRADPTIRAGQCVIEWAEGTLEFDLQLDLEHIRRALNDELDTFEMKLDDTSEPTVAEAGAAAELTDPSQASQLIERPLLAEC